MNSNSEIAVVEVAERPIGVARLLRAELSRLHSSFLRTRALKIFREGWFR
jgi:hypothetical protein